MKFEYDSLVRAVFFLFLAPFAFACAKSVDPKSPEKHGESCDGIANGFTCPNGMVCAKSTAPGSPLEDVMASDGGPQEHVSCTRVSNTPCGIGDTARVCGPDYDCRTLTPARGYDDASPPNGPSYVGGGCGGVAGFHCADGLFCQMPADQQYVADGMGTCVANSQCVLRRPGIAPDVH